MFEFSRGCYDNKITDAVNKWLLENPDIEIIKIFCNPCFAYKEGYRISIFYNENPLSS